MYANDFSRHDARDEYCEETRENTMSDAQSEDRLRAKIEARLAESLKAVSGEYTACFDDRIGTSHYIVCARHRDSDAIARSNFACIQRDAEKNYPDSFTDDESAAFIASFGHWAVGWVEYLMLPADDLNLASWIFEILDDLRDSYPVYDDDHHSQLESDEFNEALLSEVSFYLRCKSDTEESAESVMQKYLNADDSAYDYGSEHYWPKLESWLKTQGYIVADDESDDE